MTQSLSLQGCAYPNCDQDREAKMVTVRRDANGKPTIWCDPCLVPLVRALNNAGIATRASCCGHRKQLGTIMLADGRELIIVPTFEHARAIERAVAPLQGWVAG